MNIDGNWDQFVNLGTVTINIPFESFIKLLTRQEIIEILVGNIVFTNKRIIFETAGGRRPDKYTSIPYKSISEFILEPDDFLVLFYGNDKCLSLPLNTIDFSNYSFFSNLILNNIN
ncbi:MAG: PH domain-containing protein [Leadbetterella sp.]